MKNLYPSYLIAKEIKKFVENNFTTKKNTNIVHNYKSVSYYKQNKQVFIQTEPRKKFMSYVKHFAKTSLLKLSFHHSNCRTYFLSKDCLPVALKFIAVYKFTCAGCQSCYIGEAKRHLPTRIKEHLQTDPKSHILQHMNENPNWRELCDGSCFIIIPDFRVARPLCFPAEIFRRWCKLDFGP